MEVSAATGMYQRRGDSPLHRELPEVLEAMTQLGFSCFDLSFSSVDQPNFLLRGDDWERKVAALGERAGVLDRSRSRVAKMKRLVVVLIVVFPCLRAPQVAPLKLT